MQQQIISTLGGGFHVYMVFWPATCCSSSCLSWCQIWTCCWWQLCRTCRQSVHTARGLTKICGQHTTELWCYDSRICCGEQCAIRNRAMNWL